MSRQNFEKNKSTHHTLPKEKKYFFFLSTDYTINSEWIKSLSK